MISENNTVRIAIDGPGGAGKSTVAKEVAKILDIDYIDTGAMYRAFGYKLVNTGTSVDDLEKIKKMLKETSIDFSKGDTILDGEVVNDKIRTHEISMMASACSAIPAVRQTWGALQREMGQRKSVVMDGRDIGTVIFPDAEYKFFLTADPEKRAERRYKELLDKGEEITFEKVLADIKERDFNDSNRKTSPLKKADDAIEVDSTDLTIDEVVKKIISVIKE